MDGIDYGKDVCKWHSGIAVELKSIQMALNLARRELDRRLEGMNEFREQLRAQANTFMTIKEYDIAHKELERRIRALEENKSNLEGRMWIIPSIIVLIQLGLLVFKIL